MAGRCSLDVIERIRKLLALARGGGTEAEAAEAMRRVHFLLARHNLELADVEERGTRVKLGDRVHEKFRAANNPWERPVCHATASLYFCTWYYEQLSEVSGGARKATRVYYSLVGKPHNVLVARLMTHYFLKTIRRLARQAADDLPKSERTPFVHSFRVGCASRLAERIRSRKYATQSHATASEVQGSSAFLPALRPLYALEEQANRDLLKQEDVTLVSGRGRTRVTDILGEHAGKLAAEDIGLDPQLPSGRDKPQGSLARGDGQMDLPLSG